MPVADFTVFAHLNAAHSTLYRAILGVFVAERARFVISLRPAEVLAALGFVPFSREATSLHRLPSLNHPAQAQSHTSPSSAPS